MNQKSATNRKFYTCRSKVSSTGSCYGHLTIGRSYEALPCVLADKIRVVNDQGSLFSYNSDVFVPVIVIDVCDE